MMLARSSCSKGKARGKSVWMEVKKKGLTEGGFDWSGFGEEGTGVT